MKYRKISLIAIILFLAFPVIAFSQRGYYIPKSLIIPVHTQKNQLHTSLGWGGGLDANLSYSMAEHWAIFGAGTYTRSKAQRQQLFGRPVTVERYENVYKGGIGYFSIFDSKFFNSFETLIGIGNHQSVNMRYIDEENPTYDITEARYWNLFWQLHLTHKAQRHEFTTAFRIAYSDYNNLNFWTNYNYPGTDDKLDNTRLFSFDPALSYSYVLKQLKFNFQTGISIGYGKTTVNASNIPSYRTTLTTGTFLGRLSVQYNFNFNKDKIQIEKTE